MIIKNASNEFQLKHSHNKFKSGAALASTSDFIDSIKLKRVK